MKILVTGAFGNIGQKVVHILLQKKHSVACFDLDNESNRQAAKQLGDQVEVIWGDITNAQQVNDVIANVDAVIHMAAILPAVADRNPALGEKVNVGGTKNVIAAIAQCEKALQLIFCSSVSVHGNREPSDSYPLTIDTPFKANDTYAGHKIECEKLIRASEVNATIVRIGACIDADSELAGGIKDMISFLLSINPDCRLEYIHPKDVALALANAVNNADAFGSTYFLGGGPECQATWGAFTPLIFGALGIHDLPAKIFLRGGYYTEYMDTREAQRVLQFQKHTLRDYEREMNQKYRFLRVFFWPFRLLIKRWICSLEPKVSV